MLLKLTKKGETSLKKLYPVNTYFYNISFVVCLLVLEYVICCLDLFIFFSCTQIHYFLNLILVLFIVNMIVNLLTYNVLAIGVDTFKWSFVAKYQYSTFVFGLFEVGSILRHCVMMPIYISLTYLLYIVCLFYILDELSYKLNVVSAVRCFLFNFILDSILGLVFVLNRKNKTPKWSCNCVVELMCCLKRVKVENEQSITPIENNFYENSSITI